MSLFHLDLICGLILLEQLLSVVLAELRVVCVYDLRLLLVLLEGSHQVVLLSFPFRGPRLGSLLKQMYSPSIRFYNKTSNI